MQACASVCKRVQACASVCKRVQACFSTSRRRPRSISRDHAPYRTSYAYSAKSGTNWHADFCGLSDETSPSNTSGREKPRSHTATQPHSHIAIEPYMIRCLLPRTNELVAAFTFLIIRQHVNFVPSPMPLVLPTSANLRFQILQQRRMQRDTDHC